MKVILRIRWDTPWLDANKTDRFPKRKTAEWQALRWAIFTNYMLPSLQKQTHADWEAWLLCDPENAHLHRIDIAEPRVRFAYDLRATARTVFEHYDAGVFLMRIDSDDMLAPDALQSLLACTDQLSAHKFLQFGDGYAWHIGTKKLYHWANPSPPFYGYVAHSQVLKHTLPDLGHHAKAREQSYIVSPGQQMYCVLLHDDNLNNAPNRAWCRGPIAGPDMERATQWFRLGANEPSAL